MGTLYVRCKIENPVDRARAAVVSKMLVDAGSEDTWVSERTPERIGMTKRRA